MVRHARLDTARRGGAHMVVLVTAFVSVLAITLLLTGVLPGRPAERLGMDMVTAVGGPLAQRLDGVASRSSDRPGAGVQGVLPAPPAGGGALPTWTGGDVDDTPGDSGEPLMAAETAAPPAASDAAATASTTPPAPTVSVPEESTATGPVTSSPSTTPATPPTGTGSPAIGDLAQRVVELTNAERARAGCLALTVDPRLMVSAQAHAADLVAYQYFDHNGRDGSTPTTRGAAAGYPSGVAENIGTGFTDAAGVMTAWLASPGHRANIVDCAYQVIGIGYDVGALPGYGAGTWVQTFGSV